MTRFISVILLALLTACAGTMDYVRPNATTAGKSNEKILDRPREAVWNASVPALGKQFFVINNLDKSSGLINVSYSGSPEKYIDCGHITSFVKNMQGARTYDFAASKAQQSYEVMNPQGLFFLDRRMSLEGRVNLIFEEMSPTQTRVTANTRYVVQRQINVRAATGQSQSQTDTISFTSANGAAFPTGSDGRFAECVSTGALEQEILGAIQ